MRCILYARKSSESEERQVQSIDDQVKIGQSLSEAQRLTLAAALTESMSAKSPGRPEFARMLLMLDSGEADGIVCWNLNRLFRNSIDMAAIQYRLQKGIIRAIVTPERTYYPEDNMLLFYVEAGMSNQYVLDLSKSVRRGLNSKIEKGWFPHRAPEGYRNNLADHTIEPDGDRFVLLRKAWDLVLTGAYTVPQVHKSLTEWGYRTGGNRTGGSRRTQARPLSRSALYAIFDNPFYRGSFRHGGALHRGAHTPMVNADEFERVQRILHKDHHIQPQKREFPFTGLITCGACGCLVTAEVKTKHYAGTGRTATYRYYHCTGAKGCRKTGIREEYIEESIRNTLETLRLRPQVAAWITESMEDWLVRSGLSSDAERRQREEVLQTARRRLDRLFEMREEGEITREEFAQRKGRLEAQIAEAEREERLADGKAERDRTSLKNGLAFCRTAYDRFTEGNAREKREVAAAMATRYVLNLGKLEIEPHPLLAALATFEPRSAASGNTKRTHTDNVSPLWLDRWDNIRSALNGPSAFFPAFPEGA